jgi:hypothetical protein
MKIIALSLSALATLFFNAAQGDACKCAKPEPSKDLQKYHAVFAGRVVDVLDAGPPLLVKVRVAVERSWKGNLSGEATLYTAHSSCDVKFIKGESYLIYAYASEDGDDLRTSLCTRTDLLANAREDLAVLGEGRALLAKKGAASGAPRTSAALPPPRPTRPRTETAAQTIELKAEIPAETSPPESRTEKARLAVKPDLSSNRSEPVAKSDSAREAPKKDKERGAGSDKTSEWTDQATTKTGEAAAPIILREVRTGRQQGFDRIVFEFFGEQMPGYHVEYSAPPLVRCASGDEVRVLGAAFLKLQLKPAQNHNESGQVTAGTVKGLGRLPVVRDILLTCDFEGQVGYVIGLAAIKRYRVTELSQPSRLVIDVEH